jgi:hypothetical protein
VLPVPRALGFPLERTASAGGKQRVPLLFLTGTKRERKLNIRLTEEGFMREWFVDAAAGFGLLVFIGSTFLLAEVVPAVLHTF